MSPDTLPSTLPATPDRLCRSIGGAAVALPRRVPPASHPGRSPDASTTDDTRQSA